MYILFFELRDLAATYKAQVHTRRRCGWDETYCFVEGLQTLADLAWPFMEHHAKEEVTDQFLHEMDNHELSV